MKTRHSIIALAGLILGLQTGCAVLLVGAGAAAGAGAVAYVEGELKTTDSVRFDAAWASALAGIAQMQFTVTDKTHDAATGRIVARGAQDRRVEVNLKKVTEETTEIRIRVGSFGDEEVSRQLLEKIRSSYLDDGSPKKR